MKVIKLVLTSYRTEDSSSEILVSINESADVLVYHLKQIQALCPSKALLNYLLSMILIYSFLRLMGRQEVSIYVNIAPRSSSLNGTCNASHWIAMQTKASRNSRCIGRSTEVINIVHSVSAYEGQNGLSVTAVDCLDSMV